MFSLRWVQTLIALLALGGILILGNFGYLDFVKDGAVAIIKYPLLLAGNVTRWTKRVVVELATVKSRLVEREVFRAANARLQTEITSLQQAHEENLRLRQLVGLKPKLNLTTVAARVISRDPSGISGTVTIDRGREDGLSPGDAVLDEFGNLLGVMGEVGRYSSKFLLITDGLVKIDARVQRSGVVGLVTGSHSVGLLLDLISQNVTLQKDDRVVTSGLTGAIPAGILIGFVDEPQSDGSALFQKASLKPAAAIRDFYFVLVITAF